MERPSKKEYEKLKDKIKYHMNLYYNEDNPEISDEEYDALMTKLKEIEKDNPTWVTIDSPTQIIGGVAKREAGEKVTHNIPMLSIEDVFDYESVKDWVRKVKKMHPDVSFSVEQKIDGLSLTLRYRKEKDKMTLYMAETRGDGLIGEDVTKNALVIDDVKKTLDASYDYLEIRGEVYLSHDSFNAFNEEQEELGKKPAANPRNLAAGTLRQLDSSITKKRGLSMFIFNVQDGPKDLMTSQTKGLDILNKLGVTTVFHKKCNTEDEIIEAIEEIGDMRENLPYDIDGAVVKIDNIEYRTDFPFGSKYQAGHIAYKYPPEEKNVIIFNIIETVGRTGKIGFIGEVCDENTKKPVRLCKTNVSRVTLHNMDYINDMKIGIGGVYKIKKSGDIIPKLCGVVKEPKEVYKINEFCPICGEKIVKEDDTADLRCINLTCPSIQKRSISYFTSINCMNIMGLGDLLIEALINNGYLKSYADLYHLKDYRDELVEKGIIGREKNTDKLLKAIEDSKNNSPKRLLAGLGIRNVGRRTASTLIDYFKSIDNIISASEDALKDVPDIGDITVVSIKDFFLNEKNKEIILDLKRSGLKFSIDESEIKDKKDTLSGKKFVITGTLKNYKRKEIEELVISNGGRIAGSVSKNTDYLIAGENAGSKLTKAKSLNVKVISEDEFLKMIHSV